MNSSNEQFSQKSGNVFSDRKAVPEVLTIDEVIEFLRIPEVSTAQDYHNVIKNLIRFRNLPRLHMGKKLLFPKQAILEWVEKETIQD